MSAKVLGKAAKLLKPGLCALWHWSYYEPSSKRIRRLIKRHPKAAADLWIDAFNIGVRFGREHANDEMDES